VQGLDGLDEVTLTERTRVSEGKAGVVSTYHLDPSDFGVQRVHLRELVGGDAQENAGITREVLRGRKDPKRTIVCMNAALAFVAAGKAKTVRDGFALAERVIDTGAAYQKLERLVAFTNT